MNNLHKPRKRFGQNFLQDQYIIQKIIKAIKPDPFEKLIEIGPGKGALTIPLLKLVKELNMIELDRDLVPLLENTCAGLGKITIHQKDALLFDFSTFTQESHALRIVGNLPYNISTPLLFHLLNYASYIKDMHFMLQKEVVDRIVAQPNTSDYGRLSIMLQYFCHVESLFIVKPDSFYPAPKVNSAIIRLTPHTTLPYSVNNFSLLQKIVAQAFNQRRKTLRNSLKTLINETQLEKLNISPQSRPENLSLQDYVNLCLYLETVED
ncbi:MAG: Ribosomal RNA small subunit methyltransferase A [Legionellaceae bacterium]